MSIEFKKDNLVEWSVHASDGKKLSQKKRHGVVVGPTANRKGYYDVDRDGKVKPIEASALRPYNPEVAETPEDPVTEKKQGKKGS